MTIVQARQGHKYALDRRAVLALENGEFPRVAVINKSELWPLGRAFVVNASSLTPLPMRYFHDQVPA